MYINFFLVIVLKLYLIYHMLKNPYSFNNKITEQSNIKYINLPKIDSNKILRNKKKKNISNKMLKYAIQNDVTYNYPNDGTTDYVNKGDRVWRLGINSPGSKTIDLLFNEFDAKDGVILYIYNLDHSTVLGPFSIERNSKNKVFAIPPIKGESIIVEYYVPQKYCECKSSLRPLLSINKIFSGFRDLGDSGACNNNVVRDNSITNGQWEKQIRSSVMISSGGGQCSASLINNTRNDGKQLLLTANHCGAMNAGTVITFNYQSNFCQNNNGANTNNFLVGVNEIYRNGGSDVQIGEIIQTIPLDYQPYYSGWSRSTDLDSGAVGIHHPNGDAKKITYSTNLLTQSDYGGADCWRVVWTRAQDQGDETWGTTEPGSSGSPIYNSTGKIIGQLYGGAASCSNRSGPDYYGRMDVSMNSNVVQNGKRFRDYLDPTESGVMELHGFDPVDQTSYFINLPKGWSMISSYGETLDISTLENNNIISALYGYDSNGYELLSELNPGKGYWIKLEESDTITIPINNNINELNLNVNVGWNLIGSLFRATMIMEYDTIIAVYEYNSSTGYIIVENNILESGKAYWIKTNVNQITLKII